MAKKRKNFYSSTFSNKRVKYASGGKLDVGTKGIIITHDRGKEIHCRNDAFQLFNYFADKWYGKFEAGRENSLSGEDNTTSESVEVSENLTEKNLSDADSDTEDISAAIEKEVKGLKESSSFKYTQRFSTLQSGCNNIVFIKCVGIDPSEFVQRVIQSIETERKNIPVARGVLRIHPAAVSCKARIVEIKEAAELYLPKALQSLRQKIESSSDDKVKTQFNIIYRGRNNEHLHMHDVKDAISSAADDACPTWHYNCRCEIIHLVVDVIKTVCTMGVVHNYTKYKKFNVRELFLLDEEKNGLNSNTIESRVKISNADNPGEDKESKSSQETDLPTESKSESETIS